MEIISYFNPRIFASNTFFVVDDNNNAMMFDPGDNSGSLDKFIESRGYNIKYVVITHAHFDHIRDIKRIVEKYNPTIIIDKKELEFINNDDLNFSNIAEKPLKINLETTNLKIIYANEQEYSLDGFNFRIIKTPFHSVGCICLYFKELNALFSGDTLFQGSIGRYDLPTSEPHKIQTSLNKLRILPRETVVYSGHGDNTTIGEEF